MIVKGCAHCGGEVKTYPSRQALGRGKYCSVRCTNLNFKGQHFSPATELKPGNKPHNYKGYRFTQSRPQSGIYKEIFIPNHPYANKNGYMREHRLIVEKHIGRYLEPNEVVDHINMNTLDNRIENLRLMEKREHDRMNVHLNVHKRWQ